MPRLDPLSPPYETSIAEELEKMMPPGLDPLLLFRTIAHNPRVLHKIREANLLDRGSIERSDRELAILRTCARCGSEYEWGVHVPIFARRFETLQRHRPALLVIDDRSRVRGRWRLRFPWAVHEPLGDVA